MCTRSIHICTHSDSSVNYDTYKIFQLILYYSTSRSFSTAKLLISTRTNKQKHIYIVYMYISILTQHHYGEQLPSNLGSRVNETLSIQLNCRTIHNAKHSIKKKRIFVKGLVSLVIKCRVLT